MKIPEYFQNSRLSNVYNNNNLINIYLLQLKKRKYTLAIIFSL